MRRKTFRILILLTNSICRQRQCKMISPGCTFPVANQEMTGTRDFSKDSNSMTFSSVFNPMTDRIEWKTLDENYDYHQEIARSAYADMLHDTERNKKYYTGLKWAIGHLKSKGKMVHVLDIGTGTGLLSMMAASLGADEITACEAFEPVAKCAKDIIRLNGFGAKIRLVAKRSTELTVGPGLDMPTKANLLVTEVFDTELIGEGAISTFNHAHEHLLEDDCLVVPSRTVIYAQLVSSSMLWKCHHVSSLGNSVNLSLPEETSECRGSSAVFDLQMSQLPERSFQILTDAVPIFEFDFCGTNLIPKTQTRQVEFSAKATGECDCIFFWWDLEMNNDDSVEGKTVLSCAPWWIHEKGKDQPWRDHWMQAVYFPSKTLSLATGEQIALSCSHDEYSFWFDFIRNSGGDSCQKPFCICGFHVICNPARIGMLNDDENTAKYVRVLKELIRSDSVCVFFGSGGSLLPLMAAKLGAHKVYVFDSEILSKRVLGALIRKNGFEDIVKIIDKSYEEVTEIDFNYNKVNVLLSEPYFVSSILPWHNLHCWYAFEHLSKFTAPTVKKMPEKANLYAVAMNFTHLWKIRCKLGQVEGFKMDNFDQLIQSSSDIADTLIEPHPLWEYEGIALTEAFRIFSFDFNQPLINAEFSTSGHVPIKVSKPDGSISCNGVALWMEWILHSGESVLISSGPISPILVGSQVKWNMYCKQGVYFFRDQNDGLNDKYVNFNVNFLPKSGTLDIKFGITK